MKKILIYLLLLTTLCSGVAFAWDIHPEVAAGHETTAIDLSAGENQDLPDGALHHNDHCGHGAAHLTGMLSDAATAVTVTHLHHRSFSASALPSLYIAPLLRPPIV